MTCLSDLACSMHADGELGAEAAAAEQHLEVCAACRERVAAFAAERGLLVAAFAREAEADATAVPPLGAARQRHAALAAAGLVAAFAAGPLVLARVLGELGITELAAWLNPVFASLLFDAGIDAGISILTRGNQLMNAIIETIGSGVVLALLGAGAFAALRRRGGGTALLASVALAGIVLPRTGDALEMRRAEGRVTVAADETIDDTLIAFGDSVEIDGTVTGDLVAFARRIEVRGDVEGQVITFGRSVNVDGRIGSGLFGFAQTLDLGNADIARNVYGFGQNITTYTDAHVRENAVLFGQNVELAGPVDRDVMGFASAMDVRGTIGGSLTARSARVGVEAPARIGGDVTAEVPSEDAVSIASGAVIGGAVNMDIADVDVPQNPFATGSFYLGQAVRLAAAFVTGLVVLWLVPTLRGAAFGDAMAGLAAAGVGLVALIATPIVAVIVGVTVIGIPIAVLGVLTWLVGLYLAKIVLAHFVGRRLFAAAGRERHFALALLVGLLLVLVVVNLPWIGGLLNVVLTITGLGMLVIWLWQLIQSRRTGDGGAAAAV